MNLIVRSDVAGWTPRKRDLKKIVDFFNGRLSRGSRVEILPRSEANNFRNEPLRPYSFRAFTKGSVSRVFVDHTETPESVAFLMAHELCHQLVDLSPTLRSAFSDSSIVGIEHWSDRFHLLDAEERFCDGIAGKILGSWYDREWWRQRTPSLMASVSPSSPAFGRNRRR